MGLPELATGLGLMFLCPARLALNSLWLAGMRSNWNFLLLLIKGGMMVGSHWGWQGTHQGWYKGG